MNVLTTLATGTKVITMQSRDTAFPRSSSRGGCVPVSRDLDHLLSAQRLSEWMFCRHHGRCIAELGTFDALFCMGTHSRAA
jgi:hypothetical protein